MNRRQQAAYARNPYRCVCMHSADTPAVRNKRGHTSTGLNGRSASAHFTSCGHSTLRESMRPRRPLPRLRPVLGTRRMIVVDL